ncbi:DNA ligase 4 isoform A [Micractinium conductrix]|uniref:E3 ubiquitin-protein ligase CHFR n=1 Tax=Micractinium conductrix TaxID=554055 RepID=A0A2P6V0J9_9CHLO|nr:DNA ligase 4 isoform A [Micractinium conductrix]|eukprot:PSC67603.1 DNA ligase 4 isoform A [Micractinium conductrix]
MSGADGEAAADDARRLSPSELSFDTVCRLFDTLRKTRKYQQRAAFLKNFIGHNIEKSSHDAFSVFRLVLPKFDNLRGNYQLLEVRLGQALLAAAGLSSKSQEGEAVRGWRRPTGKKSAGNFAEVLRTNIFDNNCAFADSQLDKGRTLKVGELNRQLDRLVEAAGDTAKQGHILRELMQATTPSQMIVITDIILKALKIGVGEKTVFDAWHKDAFDYFNNSGMDLKYIFNHMVSMGQRYNASLRPGVAVRPQLASPMLSPVAVHAQMEKCSSGQFTIENKFDGERMQVHRYVLTQQEAQATGEGCPGQEVVGYFSRMAIEHGQRSSYNVMDRVVQAATLGRCILDGEIIVWHKRKQTFVTFGSMKPLVNAISSGKQAGDKLEFNEVDGDHAAVFDKDYEELLIGDCELMYVAFDLLHDGSTAINDQPLHQRLKRLEELVKPTGPVPLGNGAVCGRVVPLIPGKTEIGGRLMSRIGSTVEDLKAAMEEAEQLKDEGVVVKALDSKWQANDRTKCWIKLKPDYLTELEMDALVVGAWGGKGGRANLYTQFLLALADKAGPDGNPHSWTSFCRVGTGLDEGQRKDVNDQIEDWLVEDKKPDCYNVTGKERPEVWISNPLKAPVFQIQADLRYIRSSVFATGYSLRFPRIRQIRHDKDATTVNNVQYLQDWVDSHKQAMEHEAKKEEERVTATDEEKKASRWGKRRRHGGEPAPKRAKLQAIGFAQLADVSKVEAESDALQDCYIHFADRGRGYNKAELEAVVKKLGGVTSANHLDRGPHATTHILASEENAGAKEVALHISRDRDVLSTRWLLECAAAGDRLPLRPSHYINMSRGSILTNPEVDDLGDSFTEPVDPRDVSILLRRPLRPTQLQQLRALAAEVEGWSEDEESMAAMHVHGRLVPTAAADPDAAIAARLDAELAACGVLDTRFALLRGCAATLLRLGTGGSGGALGGAGPGADGAAGSAALRRFPSVAALAGEAARSLSQLQELQAGTAGAEIRLMGGSLAPQLGQGTTHVVGVVLGAPEHALWGQPAGESVCAAALQPDTVLRAVVAQAGGGTAVASLRLGLGAGSMKLVSQSWVHASLEAAEQGSYLPAPEQAYLLLPTDSESLQGWPWGAFPASPQPGHKAGVAGAASPGATSVGAAPRRGRRVGAATQATARRVGQAKAAASRLLPSLQCRSSMHFSEEVAVPNLLLRPRLHTFLCQRRATAVSVPQRTHLQFCARRRRCLLGCQSATALRTYRRPACGRILVAPPPRSADLFSSPPAMLSAVHPSPATNVLLGQAFAAGGGERVTLGRTEDNVVSALRLNSGALPSAQLAEKLVNMVSRQHAVLRVDTGHLLLADLNTVNGTYVNDSRLEAGGTRVLQDDDMVSLGGPIILTLRGQQMPNPWVWRVKDLQQFLASFAPGQPPSPAAAAAPGGGTPGAAAAQAPSPEVYRFSPAPAAEPAAAAAEPAAASPPASPPVAGAVAGEEEGQEEEAVVSPEPQAAPPGNSQPGSLLPAPANTILAPPGGSQPGSTLTPAPAAAAATPAAEVEQSGTSGAAAVLDAAARLGAPAEVAALADDSDESADLAGFEAFLASQQASGGRPAPGTGAAGAAAHGAAAGGAAAGDGGAAGVLGARGRTRPAAAAAAAGSGGDADDVVDLACSPSKRRHGSSAADAEQEAKRARPSPEAHLTGRGGGGPAAGAAAAAAGTAAAAAAAGAGGAVESAPGAAAAAAAGGGGGSSLLKGHEHLICPICQEMLVVAHTMVPCGHPFCGECLAGWLATGKRECPVCKKKGERAPIRSHNIDNMADWMADLLADSLSDDDKAARKEKQEAWEAGRGEYERQLAAPWQQGGGRDRGGAGGGGDGRGRSDGGGADILAAMLGSIGGGLGLLGGPLLGAADPPFLASGPVTSRRPRSGSRGGGVQVTAMAAPPPRNEFYAEVTPLNSTSRFTYSNKLAFDTSDGGEGDGLAAVDEDGEDSDGSGGVYGSDSFYSPRWEASASEGEDAFPDCGELVFEPSAAGVPGVRMVTTCISGVAERTLPTAADPSASPLLVSTYESRLVEVVGGRVKAALEMEPAYLSQPVGVAAHSPRRTRSPRRAPSRSGAALGPLASCSSFAGLSLGEGPAAVHYGLPA